MKYSKQLECLPKFEVNFTCNRGFNITTVVAGFPESIKAYFRCVYGCNDLDLIPTDSDPIMIIDKEGLDEP